jgi:Ni/Co efflux regulator RcnB
MTPTFPHLRTVLALLFAAILGAAPALAEKPEWAGQGKGGGKHADKADKHAEKADKHAEKRAEKANKHADKADKHADKAERKADKQAAKGGAVRSDVRVGAFFNDDHRVVARTYYSQHYGGPKACPPGLAKKNNGCLPPGQAKKWAVGQPLPAGVVVYTVPQPVLVQLPPAPVGYRYVRVASDILLIAVGTQMVMDGISDLLRM